MSSQHRATPEHWAGQEQWATPPAPDPYATCLLELRARLEALEAAACRQHGKDAERAEPDPAASLVDRVARIIATFANEGLPGDNATPAACAAIREVAAWLNERDTEVQFDPNRLEAPTADEAIGWLYDEANR